MVRLKTKLSLFNLLSKLVFTALFLIFLPWIIERINLRQVDNDLIQKREKTIDLISSIGIEPFISSDTTGSFGSFNILKEEYISLELIPEGGERNEILVSDRTIEDEVITYRVLNYTFMADGETYLLEIGKSLETITEGRKSIYRIILGFLAFIILITLVTDLQYTRIILKPLKRITDKLREISSPSKFDRAPVRTSTFDFATLDKALIDLMSKIEESFRKEKEITVNISHELMTPVSVMRSKLENILIQKDIGEETAIRIEESLQTLQRLQRLVNSLLMIARIESHQYLLEEKAEVRSILAEITGELRPVTADKEIDLKEEYEDDGGFGPANRPLLFSMFYNVVNNAVKNTFQGGTITIKIQRVSGILRVVISDTGRGMDQEQLSALFSRFSSRRGNDENGTGIGLAITKSIADLHQIGISVSSSPGNGTEFIFIFPENS
ncbi:MAG TPA: HAMP domain-containing sensor histidine kinase [Bacteroidales bacterium]|jgi:signal transduction histidine kinase|nr:HAMP domain-containing sensor histidine kinase [Bacteroidales bacterium]